MYLPPNMTEAAVLQVIETVVRILGPKFKIPGFDRCDVAQEGRIFAIECLPRYDPAPDAEEKPTRPLANFVYSHVRRRLMNLLRDHTRRMDGYCRDCADGVPHEPGPGCERHAAWEARQSAKMRVRRPFSMTDELDQQARQPAVEDDVATRELLALIDERLPVHLRADWLRMRAGIAVPKAERLVVEQAVREILGVDMPAEGPARTAALLEVG